MELRNSLARYEALLGGVCRRSRGFLMKNDTRSEHRHRVNASAPLAERFTKFAQATAIWTGHPLSFLLAVAVIMLWVISGPVFHYSDTWQLVINTGTTIVTFLMVFLIQNTQNRDTMATQLKLSELVLAMKGAQNKFAQIEDLSDKELEKLHEECRARAEMTLSHLKRRQNGRRINKQRPNAQRKLRRASAS
jgi:low affinity Fe/Cu permease